MGLRIKELREQMDFTIEDVSAMTGFTRNTLKSIENGQNTDTSHLIEIAKAIGVHPKDFFDLPFEIKPRYSLSPQRLSRNQLTSKITKLVEEGDFFSTPKLVGDVLQFLEEEMGTKANSIHASVVLKRLVEKGMLGFKKEGRQNMYYKS